MLARVRGPAGRDTAADQRAQRGGDGPGVVADLAVREADDAVAGDRQARVLRAVALEGGMRAVRAPAVGLDDQALLGPEEVDLVAVDT